MTPPSTRKPRVLLVDSGAPFSITDVASGLLDGLQHAGVEVLRFRLSARIEHAARFLHSAWRQKRRGARRAIELASPQTLELAEQQLADVEAGRPGKEQVIREAGIGLVPYALYHMPDAIIVVSAMFLHPDILVMLKRSGLSVFVLFTESPYDLEKELYVAKLVEGGWTHERSALPAFQAVNANMGYSGHGWHPLVHRPGLQPGDEDVPAHDVVFVGSVFRERIELLEAIDWTGIDFALYGPWGELPDTSPLRAHVRGDVIDNARAAALYRRAKIGLNLYRTSIGWGPSAPQIAYAESLNPRAYELAACGAFSISSYRAEVREVFGDRVPTFQTPTEAATLIRQWLADAAGREAIAETLPACVAEASWRNRATAVLGDLHGLLAWPAA